MIQLGSRGEKGKATRRTLAIAVLAFGVASACSRRAHDADERTTKARLLQKACDRGSAQDCADLGLSFEIGDGVPQDKAKAAQLHHRACDGAEASSCFNLGLMYTNGQGVAKDKVKAAEFYHKAAQLYQKARDSGEARSCYNLGVAYDDGQGAPEDKARAAQFFEKACTGGIPAGCEACRTLGIQPKTKPSLH